MDLHVATHLDRYLQLLEKLFGCGHTLRSALAEGVRSEGLSESEFRLLWLCARADVAGVHQTELSHRLAVSTAQVSALVEQLRQKQLLLGQRSPSDRRRQCWRVTPKGRAVLASLAAELNPRANQWLDRVTPDQLRQVTAVLDSITSTDQTSDAPRIERGAA